MFPRERKVNFRSSIWRREHSRMRRREGMWAKTGVAIPLTHFPLRGWPIQLFDLSPLVRTGLIKATNSRVSKTWGRSSVR